MRHFDVVVLGATGYTGSLVADYIATHCADNEFPVRWAIAGRSKEKLCALKQQLPSTADCSILAVDFADQKKLETVCAMTTVVVHCAGPYFRVGLSVAAACVKCGTHYLDITGEVHYMRRMIETLHVDAESKGVVMIPACGFDSVPSDVGNFLIHERCSDETQPLESVKAFYSFSGAGGISRGTLESICFAMDTMSWQDMRPTVLCDKAVLPSAAPTAMIPWYDRTISSFTAPSLMAGTNEQVVRRANSLRQARQPYSEVMKTSLIGGFFFTLMMYMFVVVMWLRPTRWFARKFLFPKSGEHAAAAAKKGSSWAALFLGKFKNGKTLRVRVSSKNDPYSDTAMFVAEAAMMLTRRATQCPAILRCGVLTATTALGPEYVQLLQKRGVDVRYTM